MVDWVGRFMLGGPINDVVELGVDGCDHCCSPFTIIVSGSSSGGIMEWPGLLGRK